MDLKEYRRNLYLKNRDKILQRRKEYYQKNKEKQKEYFKSEQGRLVKKKSDKKYYENNKKKILEYNKKWRTENKEIERSLSLKYYHETKHVRRIKLQCCRIVSRYKKKYPKLFSNKCCICGSIENIEQHHPDYNFPLSTYPLCKKHHIKLHTFDKK